VSLSLPVAKKMHCKESDIEICTENM